VTEGANVDSVRCVRHRSEPSDCLETRWFPTDLVTNTRAINSVARVLPLQGRSRGFESLIAQSGRRRPRGNAGFFVGLWGAGSPWNLGNRG
jgi:hypothetical protein